MEDFKETSVTCSLWQKEKKSKSRWCLNDMLQLSRNCKSELLWEMETIKGGGRTPHAVPESSYTSFLETE